MKFRFDGPFLQGLSEGLPKDKALQQAKLAYIYISQARKYKSQPFYWATFLAGECPARLPVNNATEVKAKKMKLTIQRAKILKPGREPMLPAQTHLWKGAGRLARQFWPIPCLFKR